MNQPTNPVAILLDYGEASTIKRAGKLILSETAILPMSCTLRPGGTGRRVRRAGGYEFSA
jgi:hypothetical protein